MKRARSLDLPFKSAVPAPVVAHGNVALAIKPPPLVHEAPPCQPFYDLPHGAIEVAPKLVFEAARACSPARWVAFCRPDGGVAIIRRKVLREAEAVLARRPGLRAVFEKECGEKRILAGLVLRWGARGRLRLYAQGPLDEAELPVPGGMDILPSLAAHDVAYRDSDGRPKPASVLKQTFARVLLPDCRRGSP